MLKNIKSTLSGSVIYSLGNVSTKVVGLVLLPIYTDKLSIDEYGMLGLLEVSTQLLISTFGFGLFYAFERWYWDKDYIKKRSSIFFTILLFVFLIANLIIAGVIGVRKDLSALLFNSSDYAGVITLMAIVAGLEMVCQTPSALVRLKNRPAFYSFAFITKLFTILAFTLYFLIVKDKKLEGIYQAQLIGQVVYLGIYMQVIVRNIKIKAEWKILIDMLNYRLPLIFSSMFMVLLSFTDRFALKFLSGLSDVALYSFGFKLSNTIKILIIQSVWLSLNPLIYKMMDQPGNKRFYSKIMTYFTFVVLIFVMAISLYGKEIILLFAKKPEYGEAYMIIPIIALALLFGMLKDVAMIGLNITKRTRIIGTLIVIIALLNLGLNLLLIPFLGSIGAALASLVSQIVFFVLVYYFAQRHYPIPFEIPKVLLMIFVAGGLYVLNLLFAPAAIMPGVLFKLLLIAAFPVVLYFVKFYEPIELDRIRGAYLRWNKPGEWGENIREFLKSNDDEASN